MGRHRHEVIGNLLALGVVIDEILSHVLVQELLTILFIAQRALEQVLQIHDLCPVVAQVLGEHVVVLARLLGPHNVVYQLKFSRIGTNRVEVQLRARDKDFLDLAHFRIHIDGTHAQTSFSFLLVFTFFFCAHHMPGTTRGRHLRYCPEKKLLSPGGCSPVAPGPS